MGGESAVVCGRNGGCVGSNRLILAEPPLPPLPTSPPLLSRPLPAAASLSPVARACVCLLLHDLLRRHRQEAAAAQRAAWVRGRPVAALVSRSAAEPSAEAAASGGGSILVGADRLSQPDHSVAAGGRTGRCAAACCRCRPTASRYRQDVTGCTRSARVRLQRGWAEPAPSWIQTEHRRATSCRRAS